MLRPYRPRRPADNEYGHECTNSCCAIRGRPDGVSVVSVLSMDSHTASTDSTDTTDRLCYNDHVR